MTKIELDEEVRNEILCYLGKNQPEVYWDYREELSKEQIQTILNEEDGLNNVENEIWEMNIDHRWELEINLAKNAIEEFELDITPEEFREEFMDFMCVNLNVKQLVNNVGEITMLLYMYSNYDCTNSFDTMETSEYLRQVYKRVKTGVKKEDFMYEHSNGAYGGSLFCFVFKMNIFDILDLKRDMKKAKKLLIPKGTQFGFFSSFQGSSSVFDKVTYQDMKINIRETGKDFNPEYDNVDIVADITQHYSLHDVFGQDSFIDEQNITAK
jgi:hypothetical protein